MTLAYLCKQLEKSGLVEDLSVTAFVVDHKAREESSREASMVKGWLDELEITTKILELDWSTNTSEGKARPSAFETFARRLRFQALGTACRDNNIETLMMGHHQDDNVETTLWRLCTGARGAGLMGIPRVARIPECHGIYGVAESGEAVGLLERRGVSRGVVASGGLSICRPLLSFPKARLLDTCHEHDIPYVDDPTNFDPTLTPRNAIRILVSENRLPRALAPPSILSLIQASQDLLKDTINLSNEILRHCNLIDLNLTSGTMIIQFPPLTSAQPAGTIPTRRTTKNQDQRNRQIQAVTLRRITELVSPFPENHFPLRSFENFTERVFQPSTETPKGQAFTLGGIMFQPFQRELADHGDAGDAWFLSRQPFMRNRLPALDFDTPVPPVTNQQEQHIQPSDKYDHTPWKLWDNRYWFRFAITPNTPSPSTTTETNDENGDVLLTEDTLPVTIRPLQQADLHHLREYLSSSPSSSSSSSPSTASSQHQQPKPTQNKKRKEVNPLWTQLSDTLSRESPGQSRFTIPVLIVNHGGKERVLALPTLDIRFTLSMSILNSVPGERIPCEIHWEWMYKMIDEETVKSMSD
ncbi:tRNA lysidine(34) synthetase [Aspergillus glaucus CBS 516.65]|uniref:tRNA(Ile)-lysidine synthetase n=1 Tax=Aspergillus glaucus CBS 516.65 TaxID=1160497 RepID=A0A1L9VBR3_ASPGL|nr:hypothetical protein ASPGLDRAFT_84390 [Aspergillus glaucus CBS 516.65]OJJ81325.1 hypothetical protein ASPGLDRAFT_84390 [Aspergillus glaucus CBS 516.65]